MGICTGCTVADLQSISTPPIGQQVDCGLPKILMGIKSVTCQLSDRQAVPRSSW